MFCVIPTVCISNLALSGLAPQLLHRLHNLVHARCPNRMSPAFQPAQRADWNLPIRANRIVSGQMPTLSPASNTPLPPG